jgi:hypothetical protein
MAHVASTQSVAAGYHFVAVLKLDAATIQVPSGQETAELPFAALPVPAIEVEIFGVDHLVIPVGALFLEM